MWSVQTIDTWVAPNGSGRQRIVTGAPTLLIPTDKHAWEAEGSHAFGPVPGVTDIRFPTTTTEPVGGPLVVGANGKYYLAYPDLGHVPTEPSALKRYLDQHYKVTGGPTTLFFLAITLLQEGAPPALRVAIFHLIEQLPGIHVVGRTRDEAGRFGLGIAVDSSHNRCVLVFDTKTSAALGTKTLAETTSTQHGETIPKGTLLGYTNFGPTAVVSSVTTLPTKSK
jgi:hypothetical protein